MKLEIIPLIEKEKLLEYISIEQGSVKRQWMSETIDLNAYKCLPLNIANQHGWAIYPNKNVSFIWNGVDENRNSFKFTENDDDLAVSWFGHGIVTFQIPFLVRLEEGYNLYITGAPNHHIKGIQACSGIYEADRAPYTFTMNWRVMQPFVPITFTKSDPVCFFFPIKQNLVENTEIKYSLFEDQDEYFTEMYNKFQSTREKTIQKSIETKTTTIENKYMQGLYPDGQKCPYEHRTKLITKRLKIKD
jgi:hypothetical protein